MTTLILQLNQVEQLSCSDLTVDRLVLHSKKISCRFKSLNNHLLHGKLPLGQLVF